MFFLSFFVFVFEKCKKKNSKKIKKNNLWTLETHNFSPFVKTHLHTRTQAFFQNKRPELSLVIVMKTHAAVNSLN